jgi:predicted P-loop ATPase
VKLTAADYATHERCGITREIVDAAGLFRVSSIEGGDRIGCKDGADYSGVMYPYRWPGDPHVTLERLRLDHPPVNRDGKEQGKYRSAPGARNKVYTPPCSPDLVFDVSKPIVFTEGEKKVLALWRISNETGNGTGAPAFLPLGLAGVWSWRGTTGIRTSANGERVPEKGVISDFDRIPWHGRRVTILFDANTATNEKVRAARRALAAELTQRGAVIWIIDLPAAPGVNGIDDYLGKFGLESANEVLKRAVLYEWRNDLIRSDSNKILAILANAITALRSAPEWCGVLRFNEHALSVSTTRDTPFGSVETWTDHHTCLLVDWLQHHGLRIGFADANAAVETVARDRCYHPVRQYLDSLVWDGISRIDHWLTLYVSADASDLTRAIAARWLISAVARIYEPGCQADHVIILEALQGEGKTTALHILGEPFYTDDIPELGTKDASLSTAGVWIIELSELDAMTRAEVSKVKSFVSRRTDRFRPPFGRRVVEAPRQCVFAGSVNHQQYLKDESGGRRFWPVKCGRIDLDSLRRDRDQLWAEAVVRYRRKEPWWLDTKELIEAVSREQEDRYLADPWESVIAEWLDGRDEVTTAKVLEQALNKKTDQWTRADETRVGVILRRLKWEPKTRPRGTSRRRVYAPRSNWSNGPTS